MTKHTLKGNFVAEALIPLRDPLSGAAVDWNREEIKSCKDFRSAIHALHAEVGDSHFGNRTDYEDGSWVREFLRGPKDGGGKQLVGCIRFIPAEDGATPAKSARKAKPARKTARKSGRKAAEVGKAKPSASVHFTAKQKEILLAGLRKFVNGLR